MADISRRSLFGALAALVTVPVLAVAKPSKKRTFGHITVNSCAAHGFASSHARVCLNGVDVTKSLRPIIEADDERGFIVRYARDEHGRMYAGSDGRIGRETIYGKVEISVREGGWLV